MKRIAVFILSFILTLSSLVTAYAEDLTHPADEPIVEEYVDLLKTTNKMYEREEKLKL